MTAKLQKTDTAGIISNARGLVAKLLDQAKDKEIDEGTLNQLSAVLDVADDAASDETSAPSTTAGTGTTAPSESTPSSTSTSTETSTGAPSDGISSVPTEMHKTEEPSSYRPPVPTLMFDGQEDVDAKVPEFINALLTEDLHKAQMISGKSQQKFDRLFHSAQNAIVGRIGTGEEILRKLQDSRMPADVGMQTLKKAATSGYVASSVPGVNLIQLAKLMLPVYAGLTMRLPADSPKGMGSNQATWKAMLGFGTLDFSDMMYGTHATEGDPGVNPTSDYLTFNSPYNDLAVTDNLTLKSIAASRGYTDVYQQSVIKTMSALIQGQEHVVLGSNIDAISAPGTITSASTAGTGTLSSGSPIFKVTALTYTGNLYGSTGSAAGVTPRGETVASASAVGYLGATGEMTLTWPAVENAVAYNVYMSTDNNASHCYYVKTVKINKAVITAAATGTHIPPSADTSANAKGINGIISWAELSTILSNSITGKLTIYDNAGGGLTAQGGGIKEIDQVLSDMWTKWKIAPTLAICSANMALCIAAKLGSLNYSPVYVLNAEMNQNKLQGAMMVTSYTNKFSQYADGSSKAMEIMAHPSMPDGTIVFLCESVPYPMADETRGFVRDVLQPYTYFPLPSVDSTGAASVLYKYNITTFETVECFNPGPQTALVGVDYTL
jgi:hypothetical protein